MTEAEATQALIEAIRAQTVAIVSAQVATATYEMQMIGLTIVMASQTGKGVNDAVAEEMMANARAALTAAKARLTEVRFP